MTILVATSHNPEPWIKRLAHLFPERAVVGLGELFDRRSVHYVVSWHHPEGSLAGLPNLSLIFSTGAGVDHLILDEKLPDVPIVRVINPDLTNRMSEYVVLHCLRYLRQVDLLCSQQAAKIWRKDSLAPSASDVRVGIMGYGVLGQDAALKLRMMGFCVSAWARTPHENSEVSVFHGEEELDLFLSQTDILVCLLPLTSKTKGILNLNLFEKLSRHNALGGAYLINCSRGKCQNESDIITALERGILKGATLDVFETEPLPENSDLWTQKGITITPHNAAFSHPEYTAEEISEAILSYEQGRPIRGLVHKDREY